MRRKKKMSSVTGAVAAMLVIGLATSVQAYLLTNGSFENAPTGGTAITVDQNTPGSPTANPWYGWRVVNDGTGFYAGIATDQPTGGKDGNNFAYMKVGTLQTTAALRPTAAEGKEFTATLRFKTDNLSTTLSTAPIAYIDFYNNNSNYSGLIGSTSISLPTNAFNPMQTFSISAVAPAGATHAAVRLQSTANQHLNTDLWTLKRKSLGVYTFGSTTTETYAASDVFAGATMGALTRGAAITGGSPANSGTSTFTSTAPFVWEGGMARRGLFVRGSAISSDAATATSYLDFTFDPGATPMTLTGLSLDNLLQVDGLLGSYTLTVTLQSDIGGSFADYGTFSRTITTTSTSGTFIQNWRLDTIALGSAFENVTGPVNFRLLLTDSGTLATSANAIARFDNIALEGDIYVIPEPASLALLAAGGLLMLSRRRSDR
jgi:hypothetical protein